MDHPIPDRKSRASRLLFGAAAVACVALSGCGSDNQEKPKADFDHLAQIIHIEGGGQLEGDYTRLDHPGHTRGAPRVQSSWYKDGLDKDNRPMKYYLTKRPAENGVSGGWELLVYRSDKGQDWKSHDMNIIQVHCVSDKTRKCKMTPNDDSLLQEIPPDEGWTDYHSDRSVLDPVKTTCDFKVVYAPKLKMVTEDANETDGKAEKKDTKKKAKESKHKEDKKVSSSPVESESSISSEPDSTGKQLEKLQEQLLDLQKKQAQDKKGVKNKEKKDKQKVTSPEVVIADSAPKEESSKAASKGKKKREKQRPKMIQVGNDEPSNGHKKKAPKVADSSEESSEEWTFPPK